MGWSVLVPWCHGAMLDSWTLVSGALELFGQEHFHRCGLYADRESQLARGAAEQPMKDPCAGEAVLGPEFHER